MTPNRQPWFAWFFAQEAAGGLVMLAAAFAAILCANSSLAGFYQHFITAPLPLGMDVSAAVKDILMAIFFFAVGMELKIEMLTGSLAAKGQKLLPLIAAAGGVMVPALLYLAITRHHPELRAGWAIPTATDIAFALCVLQLVGKRVPGPAKTFLLAIAIYDDLAAILIIALFYSHGLALAPLAAAAVIAGLLFFLGRKQVGSIIPYLLLGVALWVALHEAGIHPTVAGVLTGIALPLTRRNGSDMLAPAHHALHPWVVYAILPLFAFTSAGLDLRGLSVGDALGVLPVAIAAGLFFGKQWGIFLGAWATTTLKLAPLPEGVNGRVLYGIAMVAGVGFTMSLFLGQLGFAGVETQDSVKLGVLAGSALSALGGALLLRRS